MAQPMQPSRQTSTSRPPLPICTHNSDLLTELQHPAVLQVPLGKHSKLLRPSVARTLTANIHTQTMQVHRTCTCPHTAHSSTPPCNPLDNQDPVCTLTPCILQISQCPNQPLLALLLEHATMAEQCTAVHRTVTCITLGNSSSCCGHQQTG